MSSEARFDPYGVELSDEKKRELIEKFAKEVMSRGLETAAVFTLEVTKPLSWIGLQFILGISPVFAPLINEQLFYEYSKLFSDRGNIELLIQRIEQLRDEKELEEKKMKGTTSRNLKERLLGFRGRKIAPS